MTYYGCFDITWMAYLRLIEILFCIQRFLSLKCCTLIRHTSKFNFCSNIQLFTIIYSLSAQNVNISLTTLVLFALFHFIIVSTHIIPVLTDLIWARPRLSLIFLKLSVLTPILELILFLKVTMRVITVSDYFW